MRRLLAVALLALAVAAPAQAREFQQAELDALLAPVALYPDELVEHILVAAAYPDQVRDAARGVPEQPHWHPSVVALLPYPELLQRMAESPQWMQDLSEAYIAQQPAVMATVQSLRARAQANGYAAAPAPATQVVYVRYYDPLVVYGPWWWPTVHPVWWRPWHVHRVFIPHHHHRHGHVHRHALSKPHFAKPHVAPRHAHPSLPHRHASSPGTRSFHRVPESQRRPIVSSTPRLAQHRALPSLGHHSRAAPARHFGGSSHGGGGGRFHKPR